MSSTKTPETATTEKSDKPLTVKESRLQELLVELEGKSETTQRPIIDEIVLMGAPVI